MTIRKFCKTLTEAENFQFALYDKYECVQLVYFPMFEENGTYIWEVK